MPRRCTVCSHPERTEIELRALSGTSFRTLSKRYGMSPAALVRHKADHLAAAVLKANDARDVLRADGLLDHVQNLIARTEGLYHEAHAILHEAKRTNDPRMALAAIREAANVSREARGNVVLLGQLTGELAAKGADVKIESVIILPGRPGISGNKVVEVKATPAEPILTTVGTATASSPLQHFRASATQTAPSDPRL